MKRDFAAEAAANLSTHQYTCLTSTPELEVWKCRRADSEVHSAFTLTITAMGMIFMGDYDAVVFSVGQRYGLPFLARQVDSYYTEKLESTSRSEVEYDEAKALEFVREAIFYALENEGIALPDEEKGSEVAFARRLVHERRQALSGPIGKVDSVGMDAAGGISVTLAMDEPKPLPDGIIDADLENELDELVELADDVEHGRIERAEQFYEALSGLQYTHIDDYPTVTSFTENLMYRLHMISHAANAILKIKADEDKANAETLNTTSPVGAVLDFYNADSRCPAGWLICNGAIQQVAEYPELAALVGKSYGGDGVTTFAVPDNRILGKPTIIRAK